MNCENCLDYIIAVDDVNIIHQLKFLYFSNFLINNNILLEMSFACSAVVYNKIFQCEIKNQQFLKYAPKRTYI